MASYSGRAAVCALSLVLVAAGAVAVSAEAPVAGPAEVVERLEKVGLPGVELRRFLSRAEAAEVSGADQVALLGAVYSDRKIPHDMLLSKSFEAIAKGVPSARAVPAIEALRAKLVATLDALTRALGEAPDPTLVKRASQSCGLGLELGDLQRLVAATARERDGEELARHVMAMLSLCDQFTARRGSSKAIVDFAIDVSERDYTAKQVMAVAALVHRDFESYEMISPATVLEAFAHRVANEPPPNEGDAAVASSGGKPGGGKPAKLPGKPPKPPKPPRLPKPPKPPHPPHPKGK